MIYILIGCLAFLIGHTCDIIALKKIPWMKPAVWITGSVLFAYTLVMLSTQSNTLPLPLWTVWPGWILFTVSSAFFIYSLFINLPFRKTYVAAGIGDKLIRNRLYSLTRHPGVIFFTLFLISLVLISRSYIMLSATPVFILLDIILVVIQDKVFFVRMFAEYREYQKVTPMLFPNRQSISTFINSIKQSRT
jgi:protein-S-isoprenylcysteine O-methyltransferase Ste14